MSRLPQYGVQRVFRPPSLSQAWESNAWEGAAPLQLSDANLEGSAHVPRTLAKAVYDDAGIYVAFKVEDRYMRVVNTEPQSAVWKDSCVEFFFQPQPTSGYFNFEFNCAGAALMRHNRAIRDFDWLTPEEFSSVAIFTDGPREVVDSPDPITWHLSAFIPWSIFQNYYADFVPKSGTHSRGNFYKCCDECSHPHWLSWAAVGEELSFHQPHTFGELQLL